MIGTVKLFGEVIILDIGMKTDAGRIRDNNQDAYYIPLDGEEPLFIIADGMGGHKAGEIASNLAVEIISKNFNSDLNLGDFGEECIKKKIFNSIDEANNKIYNKAKSEEKCSGMGTTVTLAYVTDKNLYIGHVGDSRAYVLSNNKLSQVTEDHSLVEELIKNGSISREEAKYHPQRNIITRAVGTGEKIDIDIIIIPKEETKLFLLCTDGLTNMLDDNEIEEFLINSKNVQRTCEDLVELSNDRGGYDNITVIAVKF